MTLNDLTSKFSDLGNDYSQTFIDFLEPENKSIVLQENSMLVNEVGDLVINFSMWSHLKLGEAAISSKARALNNSTNLQL